MKLTSLLLNVKSQYTIVNPSSTSCKITSPSQTEKQDFFCEIAKEQQKKPITLSVIQPYCNDFVHSSDHFPRLLQGLFKPVYLESDLTQLLTLAESIPHDKNTSAMVDHRVQLTHEQSKSKNWLRYRAGRITVSRFRQVLHTDPHQPSISLLKRILLPRNPQVQHPSNHLGLWAWEGCSASVQTQMLTSHEKLEVTSTGFFVSITHPISGCITWCTDWV